MLMSYRGYKVKIGYVVDSTINLDENYKKENNILVAKFKNYA